MPASRIKLGHQQQLYLDGAALTGTRELELNVTTKQVDVTGVNAQWAATLPVSLDAEVTATLYYPDELAAIFTNLATHPKVPVTLSVPGVFSGKFMVTGVKAAVPMGDVVAHDVTFKVWGWS